MNVPGYDIKEKFEFGVITEFAYPIEGTGMAMLLLAPYIFIDVPWQFIETKRSL